MLMRHYARSPKASPQNSGTTLIAQADMTILAPGPLTTEIQEQVETLADVESPGLASVYRITEASIRRALDTGRTGADLQQFLEENVLGDVPQLSPTSSLM